MKNLKNRFLSSKTYLASTIILFTILVITAGYFYLYTETYRIKEQKYNEISAIAELKSNQIKQWFAERNSEAKFFSEDLNYINHINQLINRGSSNDSEEYLKNGLSYIQKQHGYKDILIVDKNKEIIFSLEKDIDHVGRTTAGFIDSTLKSESILFTDFYYNESTKDYHLEIISPVKNQKGDIVAVMLFCFDPERYLYPLIKTWPLPSETSEILVVRQVRDSVEFINNLRHINNQPHSLKISLNQTEVPAVQAVFGYEGVLEGIDYRGEKVISSVGPVPGTSWFMVVKIDKAEVLSELYLGYIYISLFSLFLILFFAAGSAFVYSHRKSRIYKELLESLEEFRTILYSIGDAVITTDKKGNVKYLNQIAQNLTGWNEKEAEGKKLKTVFKIVDGDSRNEIESPVNKVLEKGTIENISQNTLLIAKDGTEIPISDSGAPIKNQEGIILGVVLVFRDVTESKKSEEALAYQKYLMQYVIEHSNGAVAILDRELRYLYVSNQYLNDFEIKEKNIINKYHYEVFPNLPQKWKEVHQRVLKGEVLSTERDFFEREDGNFEWTRWECRPWYHKDQTIGGIVLYTEIITERVEREQKLLQSENQFRSIVEGAPDPIFIQTNMKFAYLNPAACKLFGINNEKQLIGKFVIDQFHPEYREGVKSRINTLNVEKKSVGILLEKILKVDGSEVWVEVSGEPINFKGNNGALVFIRDVTKRIEAEKLKTELYQLLDKSRNEIYMFDSTSLRFVYANQGALDNIGFPLEELLLLTPVNIKPEFNDEKFKEIIEPLISGKKELVIFETIHQRKDGTIYPVEIYLQLHKLEDQNLFLAIINDITERKKNEQALRESEQRWKFAIEGAGDGLWDWNIQTNEVYFSKNWKTMLGYDENEIENDLSEWSKRVHKDDLKRANENLKKHLNGESHIYINEQRILCKDGSYKWILDRGIVMSRDEEGNPLRMIGTHKDINEEKLTQIKVNEITELNQLAYSAAGLGIWRHNIISGEIYFDARAKKYYGVERDKIFMDELMTKIYPQDVEKLKIEMGKVINPKSDGKTTIEYRVIHSDGKVHWLQINTRINFEGIGESRQPVLGFGTVADITERKEAENNLRMLKDELASQVEAKTKELKERISELERFRDATIDRELRMKELREEIKRLKGEV